MRTSSLSNLALVAASLLVRDVVAGRHDARMKHRHRDVDLPAVTVWEEVDVYISGTSTWSSTKYSTTTPSGAIPTTTTTEIESSTSSESVAAASPSGAGAAAPAAPAEKYVPNGNSKSNSDWGNGGQSTDTGSHHSTTLKTHITPPASVVPGGSSSQVVPGGSSSSVVPGGSSSSSLNSGGPGTSTPAPTGGTGGGGVGGIGLTYNDASLLGAFQPVKAIYAMDWAHTCSDAVAALATAAPGAQYVPMLHDLSGDTNPVGSQKTFVDDVKAYANMPNAPGKIYLQGYNEPEMNGISADPNGDGITNWNTYMGPFQGNASYGIISPTVNSNQATGKPWLEKFKQAGAQWELTGTHWYSPCGDPNMDPDAEAGYMETYLNLMYTSFGNKQLAISEWGCDRGTSNPAFITKAMAVMDKLVSSKVVLFHSIFKVAVGELLDAPGTPSAMGSAFIAAA